MRRRSSLILPTRTVTGAAQRDRGTFFDFGSEEVRTSETLDTTASEIAAYMRGHPNVTIWIDGDVVPRGTDPEARAVRARRLDAVRAALIKGGVPAHRIRLGTGGLSPFKW